MERKIFVWDQKFLPQIEIRDLEFKERLRKVLRLKNGDTIILLNNFEEKAVYQIKDISKVSLVLISKEERKLNPPKEIDVFLPFVRKQVLEEMIFDATMLGVNKIYLFRAERSQYQLSEISERFYKIIAQAMEIVEWQKTPNLEIVNDFEEHVDQSSVVLDKEGEIFESKFLGNKLKIFAGPEGGWSEKEKEFFKNKGAKMISLGNVNLKTEFALRVFLSLANFPIIS